MSKYDNQMSSKAEFKIVTRMSNTLAQFWPKIIKNGQT